MRFALVMVIILINTQGIWAVDVCPRDWVYSISKNKCIRLLTTKDTWPRQRKACLKRGDNGINVTDDPYVMNDIDLITIASERTLTFTGTLLDEGEEYWIGLTGGDKLKWVNDNISVGFTAWETGEPAKERATEQPCVSMTDSKWKRQKCDTALMAICEISDADKCKYQNGGCQQICETFDAVRTCRCQVDFMPVDSRRCVLRNPCEDSNGFCERNCTNTREGHRECSCPLGQVLADETRCVVSGLHAAVVVTISTTVFAIGSLPFLIFAFTTKVKTASAIQLQQSDLEDDLDLDFIADV